MRAAQDTEEGPEGDVPWGRVSRFVFRSALRHPWLLTAAMLASLGVAATEVLSLGLVFPFLATLGGPAAAGALDVPLGFLIPFFEGMGTVEKVRAIAVLLLLVTAVRGVMTYVESRVTGYMKVIIEQDLRERVFDELLAVEVRYIHQEKQANLYAILHNYTRQSAALVDVYLSGVAKGITAATYMVALLTTSWQLTLLATALGAISFLAVGRLNRTIKRLARGMNRTRVRLNQVSMESLQAMKLIRTFGRESHARERFRREATAMRRQGFKKASIAGLAPPLQNTLNMALFAGLIVAATYVLDQSGDGWLIFLTLFLVIMARVMAPLSQFTKRRSKMLEEIPALEELIAFFDEDKPRLKEGTMRLERLRSGIRLERVGFSYADADVLHDVTFDVPRGSTVALVGASGSGKSTLLNLVIRLADPTRGRILVDGADLREYDSLTWRRRIAVVSQDTFLFNDTVRENIRFGKPEATDAEVEAAAKQANAHEFIAQMEQGYDTIVGDRGVRLSGGQAQRLAIARALLADPDLLILDEATSALDAGTERQVQAAIEVASRSRTVLAVTHRLATVRNADRIIVLEKGRVVEQGTHAELLARGGRYAEFARLQDLGVEAIPDAPSKPEPLRVVLVPSGTARLANGATVATGLPVVIAKSEESPMTTREGDLVVLRPGSDEAEVRVEGRVHTGVPVFAESKDAETRVRVARVR